MRHFRTIPDAIRFVRKDLGGTAILPVARVTAERSDPTRSLAPETVTIYPPDPAYRPKVQGVTAAGIGSDLRMHVELYPGTERDELLASWGESDPACRPNNLR